MSEAALTDGPWKRQHLGWRWRNPSALLNGSILRGCNLCLLMKVGEALSVFWYREGQRQTIYWVKDKESDWQSHLVCLSLAHVCKVRGGVEPGLDTLNCHPWPLTSLQEVWGWMCSLLSEVIPGLSLIFESLFLRNLCLIVNYFIKFHSFDLF